MISKRTLDDGKVLNFSINITTEIYRIEFVKFERKFLVEEQFRCAKFGRKNNEMISNEVEKMFSD